MDPKRLQFQSASSDNFDSACISACVYMDDVCVPTLVLPVSMRVYIWMMFAFPLWFYLYLGVCVYGLFLRSPR